MELCIKQDNYIEFERLIKKNKSYINYRDKYNNNILMIALLENSNNVIKSIFDLFNNKEIFNNREINKIINDYNSYKPYNSILLWAISKGNSSVIKELLFIYKGYYIDFDYQNEFGNSSLHCSIIYLSLFPSNIVKRLLELGANPLLKNNDGLMPNDLLLQRIKNNETTYDTWKNRNKIIILLFMYQYGKNKNWEPLYHYAQKKNNSELETLFTIYDSYIYSNNSIIISFELLKILFDEIIN